jgi:hypothetical protein
MAYAPKTAIYGYTFLSGLITTNTCTHCVKVLNIVNQNFYPHILRSQAYSTSIPIIFTVLPCASNLTFNLKDETENEIDQTHGNF